MAARAIPAAAAAVTVVLTTINGTSKNSTITVSGTPALTMAGATSAGSNRNVRATAKTTNTKYWFEVTINTLDAAFQSWGIDDGTLDFSTSNSPGETSSTGWKMEMVAAGPYLRFQAASGGTSVFLGSTPGDVAVGDKFYVQRDKGTGSIDVWRIRSGVTTKMGATQTVAAFTNEFAFGGAVNLGGHSFNFGQSAPSRTPDAGFVAYGA